MTCPKCRRKQYYTCGKETCRCFKIPEGKKHQVWDGENCLSCPYCGFTHTWDYWEMRAIDQGMKVTRKNYPELFK